MWVLYFNFVKNSQFWKVLSCFLTISRAEGIKQNGRDYFTFTFLKEKGAQYCKVSLCSEDFWFDGIVR